MNNDPLDGGSTCCRTIWHFPRSAYTPQGYVSRESFAPEILIKAKQRCNSAKPMGPVCSKVILVGDVAVGKTTLVNRFCRSAFNNDYKATIGVDFEVEEFSILGCKFHLQIWDTSGQERFRSLGAAYYRGARAILVAFDLTDSESLKSAELWAKEATAANGILAPVLLIGCKKDLAKGFFNMSEKAALDTAENMRAELWCTSSKTGENVCELFHRVAALTFEECLNNPYPASLNSFSDDVIRVVDTSDMFEKRNPSCSCAI